MEDRKSKERKNEKNEGKENQTFQKSDSRNLVHQCTNLNSNIGEQKKTLPICNKHSCRFKK